MKLEPISIHGVHITNLKPAINDKGENVWRGGLRAPQPKDSPGGAAALEKSRLPKRKPKG